MEALTLPQNAGKLWRAKREIIHSLPPESESRGIRPHLGGGTILAARWQHRVSVDIDVFLPGRNSLVDLQQEDEQNLLRRLGGTPEQVGPQRIKIAFAESKLDLSTLAPKPERGHGNAIVDGRTEVVLSSSQILRGKLARAHKGLVRDAADIAIAAREDPLALATAVNMLGRDTTGAIQWQYEMRNEELARDWRTEIAGVPERYQLNPATLGSRSADAISEHRYDGVTIRVEENSLTIEKRIRRGALPLERYDSEDETEALIISGIAAHLNENGPCTGKALEKAIRTTVLRGETRTVFETGNADTLAYVKDCNDVNPPPARSNRGNGPQTRDRKPGYER